MVCILVNSPGSLDTDLKIDITQRLRTVNIPPHTHKHWALDSSTLICVLKWQHTGTRNHDAHRGRHNIFDILQLLNAPEGILYGVFGYPTGSHKEVDCVQPRNGGLVGWWKVSK